MPNHYCIERYSDGIYVVQYHPIRKKMNKKPYRRYEDAEKYKYMLEKTQQEALHKKRVAEYKASKQSEKLKAMSEAS